MSAVGVFNAERVLHAVKCDSDGGLRARCNGARLSYIWLQRVQRYPDYTSCKEPQCTP